ncbi:TPA: hypothetical protein DEB00_00660 [Candidatus Uhrbacteria bacterium]|nr:hypothetical protein [Candidatus Uhrbacteria bacterium]
MTVELGTLLVSLTVLWFLVYWIFGGVVFAIISLVRPGKMKRVRFSCLYTVFSALIAYQAAKLGILWASEATGSIPQASSLSEAIVVMGGLGFVGILLGLIAGFVVLFIGGWVIMLFSRSKEKSWYDRITDKKDE